MTYQVLARKWRPRNFTEVVGQEHVIRTLANALSHHRLHHAYLFTGTRGVGKTTLARIFAKAINCEDRQDFNPCGTCPLCQSADNGSFLDLIEVDAASRTKVEDTRDLLENAQYAPNQGRYKIYLIDEVHMLSGHSFNALLKTLEEPPAHVKFLLATTDPQKIPVTVLSRCLQFNLKRLSLPQLLGQMRAILDTENIAYDLEALQLLTRAADGSMRDGLSLLDQAIVFGAGSVSAEAVYSMLGTVARQPVVGLLRALAAQNAEELFGLIKDLADLAANFGDVLAQMLEILQQVALYQQAPGALGQAWSDEPLMELAALLNPQEVQLFYQIALLGQRDLALAPDPNSGFEMVMLRMLAFRPVSAEPGRHPMADSKPVKSPVSRPAQNNATLKSVSQQKTTAESPSTAQNQSEVKEAALPQWSALITAMNLSAMTRELANNCVLEMLDAERCLLRLDARQKNLLSPLVEEKLQKAIQAQCGDGVKLSIRVDDSVPTITPAMRFAQDQELRQQAALDAIQNDENVLALKNRLDARILSGSVEPV